MNKEDVRSLKKLLRNLTGIVQENKEISPFHWHKVMWFH